MHARAAKSGAALATVIGKCPPLSSCGRGHWTPSGVREGRGGRAGPVSQETGHGTFDEAQLTEQLDKRGFLNRILGRLTRSITRPGQMYGSSSSARSSPSGRPPSATGSSPASSTAGRPLTATARSRVRISGRRSSAHVPGCGRTLYPSAHNRAVTWFVGERRVYGAIIDEVACYGSLVACPVNQDNAHAVVAVATAGI